MGYDLTGQQCVLNSRHTDCTDYGHWTEKTACVVSSVLGNGLDITRQKNVGGGRLARMGWGRGWETADRTGLQ
jgi:hypothetical protein